MTQFALAWSMAALFFAASAIAQDAAAPSAASSAKVASPPVRNEPAILGVGGDRHAFLALRDDQPPRRSPGLMPGPGAVQSDADKPTWLLYHLPATADLGSVFNTGGRRLTQLPVTWTVSNESLIFFFRETTEEGESVTRVRRLTVRAQSPLGVYAYEPAGRFEALPPLAPGHPPIAAATADGAVFLLALDTTGSETGASAKIALFRLGRTAWSPVALPGDMAFIPTQTAPTIFPWGGGLGLRPQSTTRDDNTLWRIDRARALADDTSKADWTRVTAPIHSDDRLVGVANQLLAVRRTGADDAFEVSAIRDALRAHLAQVKTPAGAAVAPLGEQLVFAWTDKDTGGRLKLRIIDANTGRVSFDGFARTAAPISQQDVQVIVLIAGAVLLTALLFALRPEERAATTLLPVGRVPAPPGRRLLGALIDIAPAVGFASILWRAPVLHALGLPAASGESAPVGPPLTALGVWFTHSALSEWRWGRTIGKMLVRCRTITATGDKPSLKQAVLRSAIKTLAPPVTALLLLEKWRRHPGDLLAGTFVVLDAETVDDEDAAAKIARESDPDAATDSTAAGP